MAEQEKEILEEEMVEETADEAVEAEDISEEAEESAEETTEETEEVPEGEEPKTWAEKRAAKKQKKEQANADKEKIAELEDKVKRQLAEFENFRNRTEKEKQAMFETGAKSVLEKILPVIDNFERGFSTVEEADKEDAFVQGMQKVYKQMMDELEKIGVKPIEAVGQEFDPNLHNAVMQVESEEFESGIVAQELMKGYMYRDSVVRHSMVGVVS
ncbi:MAG: nucleotide exchange factor GrpE [Lachnospiraceae bacterium]|nr:nucleotide exchange factor GrpE [Lachnospiraceae bacterium]